MPRPMNARQRPAHLFFLLRRLWRRTVMSEAARSVSPIVPAPNVAASRCWRGAVSHSLLTGPGPQGVQYTHIDLVEPRKGRDLDAASVTESVHRERASHSTDTHILTRDAEIIRPCISTGHLREDATLIPIENPWMRIRQAAWNEVKKHSPSSTQNATIL